MSSTSSYVPAADPRVSRVVDLLTTAVFAAWQEGFTATRPDEVRAAEATRRALDAQTAAQMSVYDLAAELVADMPAEAVSA